MRAHVLLTAPFVAVALALVACAPPPEADYPVSERARAAPPPRLAPTEHFTLPLTEGAEAIERLGPERDALAARAAALRGRGAALSEAGVLDAPDRERLAQAGAAASGAAPAP